MKRLRNTLLGAGVGALAGYAYHLVMVRVGSG